MKDSRLTGMARRFEVAVAAVIVTLAVVGTTLLPLLSSTVVTGLVTAVGSVELTGIGKQATLEVAEAVRVFVLDEDAPPLPAELGGRAAFDAAAVSHLVDVRLVIVPAVRLSLASAALAILWLLLRRRAEEGRSMVGRTMRAAGVILIAGPGVGVLAGLVDFDGLFTWFHGLFFKPGTWTFPSDALLIQVFPIPFWMSAAAIWGASVITCAVVLIAIGHRLCFTRGTHGV